jgi:hypothetical protein
MIERGYDIVAPIPSCVLMFKQELPLMFPDEPGVATVRQHMFDPFEYLALRHKAGQMRTDFTRPLGKIAYQAGIPGQIHEDRQAGHAACAGERRGLLRQRLPDGGTSNRKRLGKHAAADASAHSAQNGLRIGGRMT